MSAPLTNLLRKKPKFITWNDEAERAFVQIKECLMSAPILSNPNFDLPFQIQTDASDNAIAAVLTQQHENGEKVVAYFSQKLSPAQQSYAATEKEGLAVISAIDKFRPYIEGMHFVVITDASALTHIMNGKWRTSSRLSRWSIDLQGYDFEIRHRRGRDNIIPDALSRAVEELEVEQSLDDWYTDLIKKVQASSDDNLDFKIELGKLYKFVPTKTEVFDYRYEWKLCVPKDLRKEVLQREHNNAFHIGYEKLVEKVRQRYFWPNLATSVKKHVQSCQQCREFKPSNVSQHPEMGKQRLTTKPFQILSLDFIQSLPRSKSGNMHLLVLMDMFSKWTMLFPVKKITSDVVIRLVEQHWFRRYSVPEILITDNASCFLSKEFKAFLERYHVQHWTNARYHSQANPVERLNRSINACMRTYVKTNQRLWDTRISEVEFTINNTRHSSTGFTPYRILYGHEIVADGDEHRLDADVQELSERERVNQKLKIDRTIFNIVYANLERAHKKSTQSYNLRYRKPAPVYQLGQKVFRRNFAQSSAGDSYNAKLGPAYIPCTIVARRGTSSYELKDSSGRNIGIFSAADLRPGVPEFEGS